MLFDIYFEKKLDGRDKFTIWRLEVWELTFVLTHEQPKINKTKILKSAKFQQGWKVTCLFGLTEYSNDVKPSQTQRKVLYS